MLPDPTPQKACQNRFRRELMEWTRACAPTFPACTYCGSLLLLDEWLSSAAAQTGS